MKCLDNDNKIKQRLIVRTKFRIINNTILIKSV